MSKKYPFLNYKVFGSCLEWALFPFFCLLHSVFFILDVEIQEGCTFIKGTLHRMQTILHYVKKRRRNEWGLFQTFILEVEAQG